VRSRSVTTTRRTALAVGAGLAGLAAGGCTSDAPGSPAEPAATSAPPVDADQELVTEVAVRLAAMAVFVDALSRDFPKLRADLRPLRRLHAAHLAAVGGFEDGVPSPAPNEGRPVEVTRDLRRSEQQLQRELAAAAVRAESGALAKLLASMSAAVAQHVAVLR
jgi:hypothetical protein